MFRLILLALAFIGLAAGQKPNVLVIMTDDQDVFLDSLSVQPKIKSLIGSKGVTYNRHFCTVAWCCPSRVNFLTGRAAHKTNVTNITPPYGGWPKFINEGLNDNYLPVWINEKGIKTYYIGKLNNGYTAKNFNKPYPKGWTDSSFLVDPWTYNYFQSQWTVGGPNGKIQKYPDVHTTKVTTGKALNMLEQAAIDAKNGEQFFMMVAPVAPHTQIDRVGMPPPAPKGYEDLFKDRQVPRRGNYNPDVPSGNSWVYNLPKLRPFEIAQGDDHHRKRLRNLAAIDDMVEKFIDKLKEHDQLDNTYVIYTSDNGFHIGNHRMKPGKRCPYEEDINIPLLIRGPGVHQGFISKVAKSHTDLAPTILEMLGVPLRDDFDGEPIHYKEGTLDNSKPAEIVSVEFWDDSTFNKRTDSPEPIYYNNTYKALRLWSQEYSFFYSVWCDNTREFYDMKTDHIQMNNRLDKDAQGPGTQYFGRPETQLFQRLNTVLMVTKGCKGDSCRNPWKTIFPKGQVTGIRQAMNKKYDAFFARQPRISFKGCKIGGNVRANEGPQDAIPYSGS